MCRTIEKCSRRTPARRGDDGALGEVGSLTLYRGQHFAGFRNFFVPIQSALFCAWWSLRIRGILGDPTGDSL